jgi:hypothetical protein
MEHFEDFERFPSVGEDVIATIGGHPRECRVEACYNDGPFVLFSVVDPNGETHCDLLPHALSRKKSGALAIH